MDPIVSDNFLQESGQKITRCRQVGGKILYELAIFCGSLTFAPENKPSQKEGPFFRG